MAAVATPEAATLLSKTLMTLPPQIMKFSLNAMHDTLPHNANLLLWKKKENSICPLCKQVGQNLIHVLNSCPRALKLRRFNERHDQVLQAIVASVKEHLPPSTSMSADLGDNYSFPCHITPSDLRPDLVLWSDTDKSLTLVELTIPFETSFHEAQTRKESRYADLTQEATKSGYKTNLITVEMGSRGLAHMNGFKKLQKVLSLSKTELQTMITEASRASLTGSYKIWCTRNKILD